MSADATSTSRFFEMRRKGPGNRREYVPAVVKRQVRIKPQRGITRLFIKAGAFAGQLVRGMTARAGRYASIWHFFWRVSVIWKHSVFFGRCRGVKTASCEIHIRRRSAVPPACGGHRYRYGHEFGFKSDGRCRLVPLPDATSMRLWG